MQNKFNFSPIIGKRIHAFTVDLFFIFVLKQITVSSFLRSLDLIFFKLPFKFQFLLTKEFAIFSNLTLLSIFFTYFTLFTFLSNGRTPGKYIFGLRVFAKNHELTLFQCIGRTLTNLFCVFTFCLPFLATIYKKNNQGPSEIFSKTYVGFERKPLIVDHQTSWQLSFFDLYSDNQDSNFRTTTYHQNEDQNDDEKNNRHAA